MSHPSIWKSHYGLGFASAIDGCVLDSGPFVLPLRLPQLSLLQLFHGRTTHAP
jgi:hypothetical protein